jgi:hypothetical protein
MNEQWIVELIADPRKLLSGFRDAEGGAGKLSRAYNALAVAGSAFAASGVVQYLRGAAEAAIENDRALNGMRASVAAAGREFGARVGTVEHWEGAMQRLRNELRIYSERDVAAATERTVTMTKRLGLSADQMEVVLKRAAALGAGKTDLTNAVERVTSALRGEAESAEFLGLTLNEDYVKTRAVAMGLRKELWPALDDTAKAQIRYAVFLEQTNEAQGQFNQLAGTTAFELDQIRAKTADATVAVGNFALRWLEASGIIDMALGNWKTGAAKFLNPFDLFGGGSSSGGKGPGTAPTMTGAKADWEKFVKDMIARLNELDVAGKKVNKTFRIQEEILTFGMSAHGGPRMSRAGDRPSSAALGSGLRRPGRPTTAGPMAESYAQAMAERLGLQGPGLAGTSMPEAVLSEMDELAFVIDERGKIIAERAFAVKTEVAGVMADFGPTIAGGLASAAVDVLSGSATFNQALGGFLSSLGQSLIQTGVAGIAIKAFVKNPYAAIAAGIGLSLLGARLARSSSDRAANLGSAAPGLGAGSGPRYTPPAPSFASTAPPPSSARVELVMAPVRVGHDAIYMSAGMGRARDLRAGRRVA